MWLRKLSILFGASGISLAILTELARIIDLITYREFKGSVLVALGILLTGFIASKIKTSY